MKLNWRVAPAPTGPYSGFVKRGWPEASYPSGEPAAAIYCDDSYNVKRAKRKEHSELIVRIADHSLTPWKWRQLKARAASLEEAKALAQNAIDSNPNMQPKER